MCKISLSGCYLMLIAVLFRWNHLLQMSEGRFLSFRVFRYSEDTQPVYLLPSYRIVNMNHSLLMLFYVPYVDGALDQCCLLSHLRCSWSCTEENHQRCETYCVFFYDICFLIIDHNLWIFSLYYFLGRIFDQRRWVLHLRFSGSIAQRHSTEGISQRFKRPASR